MNTRCFILTKSIQTSLYYLKLTISTQPWMYLHSCEWTEAWEQEVSTLCHGNSKLMAVQDLLCKGFEDT